MKWKIVPVDPTQEMTSNVVLPGMDRTRAVAMFQSMASRSPNASDDEELVERVREEISRVLLQYGHEYSFGEAARAAIKIMEEI